MVRDPNWGRLAGAAGNATLAERPILEAAGPSAGRGGGARRHPRRRRPGAAAHRDRRPPRVRRPAGGPLDFDKAAARDAMGGPEVLLRLDLGLGTGTGEAFGCDLTEQYVARTASTRRERGPRRQARRHDDRRPAQVLGEIAAIARQRPVDPRPRRRQAHQRVARAARRAVAASRAGCGSPTPRPIEVAAAVLRGVVNSELVAALRDLRVDAVGLSGVDGGLLIGERVAGMGLVATVVGVHRDLIDSLLVAGQVPVVAPLARDEQGIVCNVNADDCAAGLAAGLGARQLVLLTDVDGVRDREGAQARLAHGRRGRGTSSPTGRSHGGMVPKVRAALQALAWEQSEAIIADSAAPDALARALGDPTFGTRVSVRARAAGAA